MMAPSSAAAMSDPCFVDAPPVDEMFNAPYARIAEFIKTIASKKAPLRQMGRATPCAVASSVAAEFVLCACAPGQTSASTQASAPHCARDLDR
ncbi:MAG: hypothetical protein ACRCWJ_11350 [Casimicrobium sp.]